MSTKCMMARGMECIGSRGKKYRNDSNIYKINQEGAKCTVRLITTSKIDEIINK